MSWWTGLKEAAVEDGPVVYDKIPKEVIVTRERPWTSNVGAAVDGYEKGGSYKRFFPSVRKRLTQKIPIFPLLTTMLTGHGNIKSYLYRLGLTDNRMCPCEEEEQTVDHLIFKCKKLHNQRNEMIRQIKNTGGNWPATNETLINNYQNFFVKFVKSLELSDLK